MKVIKEFTLIIRALITKPIVLLLFMFGLLFLIAGIVGEIRCGFKC